MGAENTSQNITNEPSEDPILASFRDVGQTLADARNEQNLTIKQVAAKIHIRQRYLVDLEEGRLSDLPGRVYILGFIRTYAKLLNLDAEELIRRISRLPNMPDYERSQVPIVQGEEQPSFRILFLSGALVIVLALGGYFLLRPSSTESSSLSNEAFVNDEEKSLSNKGDTASVEGASTNSEVRKQQGTSADEAHALETPGAMPPELQVGGTSHLQPKIIYPKALPTIVSPEVLSTTSTSSEEESTTSSHAPSLAKKVSLKATEPSWVEIRDGEGRVIFMKVMKSGEEYEVPDRPGVVISTGNSGGINIFVGNRQLPSLGARGVVTRGIRLDSLQK